MKHSVDIGTTQELNDRRAVNNRVDGPASN